MKKIFLIAFCGFLYSSLYAQVPDFIWGKVIGNSGTLQGSRFYGDKDGNMYLRGLANAAINFGNGITTPGPPPEGGGVAFFAKFNSSGTCLWAKTPMLIGGDMVVDNNGNIYIVASHSIGKDVFGLGNFPSSFSFDIPLTYYCLIKLDSNGNGLWFKPIYCKSVPDDGPVNGLYMKGESISVRFDSDENLLVTGSYGTDISVVNGNDTITLQQADNTGVNTFAITFDTAGTYLSHISLGVQLSNVSVSALMVYSPIEFIQTDKLGNLFRFIPNMKRLIKYDRQGNVLLTKDISAYATYPNGTQNGSLINEMNRFAVDPNGNVYLSGRIRGYNSQVAHTYTIEGFTFYKYGNWNSLDAWLVKLSADSLNGEWLAQYPNNTSDDFKFLTTDALGNVYVAGEYGGAGASDAQLIKYNTSGELLWRKIIPRGNPSTIPYPPPEAGVGPGFIFLAKHGGNIMVGGEATSRIQFDASQPIIEFNYVTKIWFAQYGICGATAEPVIASASTVFCAGDSLQLTAQGGVGNYLWNFGDTTASVYAHQSAMYSVIDVQDDQCYGQSDPLWVHVLPLPQVQISASDSVVCAGEEVTLTASGADTYSWSNGISNNIAFVPDNTGTYTVTGTDSVGCHNTAEQMVVVNQLPDIQILASDSVVCAGGEVTLTASGADTYSWSNGISNNIAFVPDNTGIYTVTGTDSVGCHNTAEQMVVVNTLPPIPVITAVDSELTSSVPVGNQWYFEGEPIAGATQQMHTATQDGSYYVVVTDGNHCEAQSEALSIIVTGIASYMANNGIIVYPNPTSGIVHFSAPVNIKLKDVLGEIIADKENINSLDISKQPAGIYFISFFDPNGNIIQYNKIIKK